MAGPFSVEADAPKGVEVTTFHQPDRQRYLIGLVNFQKELPNIPVSDIRVRLRLGGRSTKGVYLLPEEKDWPYQVVENQIEFVVPTLETLHMFAVDYR